MDNLNLSLVQAINLLVIVLSVALSEKIYLGKRWLLLICVFTTVPVSTSSIQSTVFVSDLALPVLAVFEITKKRTTEWRLLSLQLIIIPLISFGINRIGFPTEGLQSERDIAQAGMALYRAVTLTVICGAMHSWATKAPDSFRPLLEIFIKFSALWATLGALSLLTGNGLLVDYSPGESDLAYGVGDARGFGGLFRGAIGAWFSVSAAVAATASLVERRTINRLWAMYSLVASIVMLLLSYSRIGVIAATVGVAISLVLGGGSITRRRYPLIAIALILLILIRSDEIRSGIVERALSSQAGGMDDSTFQRLNAWEGISTYLKSNNTSLMIGVGGYNLQFGQQYFGVFGSHNTYLDILTQCGIFGLVAFLVLIYRIYKSANPRRRSMNNEEMLPTQIVIQCTVVLAVVGLTQESFYPVSPLMATPIQMAWAIVFVSLGAIHGFNLRSRSRA